MTLSSVSQASPRRLLHVFSTFRIGGPQVRFALLANALGAKYKHSIISMDGSADTLQHLGASIDANMIHASHKDLPFHRRLMAYRQFLRTHQPDQIITYNWGAIEWALANLRQICPHVHIEDGFGPEESHRQLARRVWTRRLALSRKSLVVVPSRTLYGIASNIWKLPRKRLLYLPNGVNCQRFSEKSNPHIIDSLGLPKDRALIGTVTALRPEKNISRLIHAFAVARQSQLCHLVIIGEGGERSKLEDLTKKLNLQQEITFAGHVSDPEHVLAALDIYAISSDTEQMPYGVLEAMASALPIAGVDVGDVKSMVANPNQTFITPKDVNRLAQTLKTLVADIPLRQSIGRENQNKARKDFNESQMINAYDRLFRAGDQANHVQESHASILKI